MGIRKLFSLDFFFTFQDKEKFHESLVSEENIWYKIANKFLLMIAFSFVYGIAMGSYNGLMQAIASALKLPLLLLFSVLVSFPELYILQQILGSKLGFRQTLHLILSGFVMIGMILVSFAPLVIFFLITGDNYSFIKLLHVAIFGLAGFVGMKTILDALKYACEDKKVYPKIGVAVFRVWILILAFVGMQLGWNLRPFIGSRELDFEWFRQREGNFYIALGHTVQDMFEPSDERSK